MKRMKHYWGRSVEANSQKYVQFICYNSVPSEIKYTRYLKSQKYIKNSSTVLTKPLDHFQEISRMNRRRLH